MKKFKIGQMVYHKLDGEKAGMVTGVLERPNGYTYFVTWTNREESPHYACELTEEKSYGKET